jgi:hypothetical protein
MPASKKSDNPLANLRPVLESHPFADLFPMLDAAASDELGRDIESNGLYDAIWLYEGKILDGRNRYRECLARDVDPKFQEYRGRDPLGFVISKNLHRRHLSETQRATVAAKIATARKGGQPAAGERSDSAIQPRTVKEAAKDLNVGATTVKAAKTVLKHGTAELVKLMEADEITASAAAEVAKLPKEKQAEILKGGAAKVKLAAAEARAEKPVQTRPMPHETRGGKNKPAAPGVGGATFTFGVVEQAFGHLTRAVDRMAVAYGEKDSRPHHTALENLEAVIRHLNGWHNRHQKKEGK